MATKGSLLLEKLRSRRAADQRDKQWHNDLASDAKQRQAWVQKMLANDEVHSTAENNAVAIGSALFDVFKMDAAAVMGSKYRMKYDQVSKRLLGKASVTIPCASAEDIVAYLMENNRSKITRSILTKSDVRDEVLEDVNGHCNIIFNEMSVAPFANRTWLNMCVWKRVSEEPRTYIWVVVPILCHKGLRPEDERHAVRSEVVRCCKVTAVSATESQVDFVGWVNLKGQFPQWLNDKFVTPEMMRC
jgi:hypothetical protein